MKKRVMIPKLFVGLLITLALSSCSGSSTTNTYYVNGNKCQVMAVEKGKDVVINKVYTVDSINGITDSIDGDKSTMEAIKTFILNLQDIGNYGMTFEFIYEFTNYVPLADFTATVEIQTSRDKVLKPSSTITGYIETGKHYLGVSYRMAYELVADSGVPETAHFSYSANKLI